MGNNAITARGFLYFVCYISNFFYYFIRTYPTQTQFDTCCRRISSSKEMMVIITVWHFRYVFTHTSCNNVYIQPFWYLPYPSKIGNDYTYVVTAIVRTVYCIFFKCTCIQEDVWGGMHRRIFTDFLGILDFYEQKLQFVFREYYQIYFGLLFSSPKLSIHF